MRAIGTFYYVQRWRSPTIVCSTYLWFATTTTKRKHLFCLHPALTELFLIQRSESSAGTSKPAVSRRPVSCRQVSGQAIFASCGRCPNRRLWFPSSYPRETV